ncbi:breast carcinoma-amplified sequence 1 isoform X3 [Anolis sagrei]|uniref:breast carcinoma-amplified sequence 1 isoform X3 n=1 Tax=Anolis sagrei TaxID=38937 RepID=UPI0035213995
MGNSFSLEMEPEDQEPVHGTTYSPVSSEPPDSLKNGPVTIQPVQTDVLANGNTVDAKVTVLQDNAAISSQKTMEISTVSEGNENNLGKEAKAPPPAAKSRFSFSFSRPVPGRNVVEATNSSVGPTKLDVSSEVLSENKASSENPGLPAAAVAEEASNKNLNETSLSEIELTEPDKREDDTVPKPKEISFFERIFKLEKGKEKKKAQEEIQKEDEVDNPGVLITAQETSGLQSTPDNILQGTDVTDDSNQKAQQQGSTDVNCLASVDLAQEEVKPDNVKTANGTDSSNPVMSYFNKLVSQRKTGSKADSEDKVKKDAQQTEDTKITEQPATTTPIVKTEINIPPPQENLAAKQNIKAPEPPVQQQATATVVITNEAPKEVTKERSQSTPTPLSKFFRKKTPTDDIEVINTEKIEASPVVPAKEENRSQEAAETKSKGEEKTPKTNLRKFFKLSIKSDAKVVPSEEVNEQAPDRQTLDFTDRSLTQAENREPVLDERSQASSTETLSKQEGDKQEVKDLQDVVEQETVETASFQNGGDTAKENTPKRIEKRQSFGGFFKGLSPKRMSDAQVQTDPVSIVPFVKPK